MTTRATTYSLMFLFVTLFTPVVSATGADDSLDDMVAPITNPVNFEDPRHTTELRAIALYHELQDDLATEGGNVQVYALQARFKLSDDLSLIATKDGWTNVKPNAVVSDGEGFANVALGAKYSLLREGNFMLTSGLRYEIPIGELDVLQSEGGIFNPFLSGAISVGGFNLMAASGLRVRTDSDDSSFWDLDAHIDYPIGNFSPTVEFNLVHVMSAGDRLPIADEGIDFFNFGSALSAGTNIPTVGVGARYRVSDNIDLGLAYQFPLDRGEGTGAVDWRVTGDVIFRFEI